jgi:LPS export ABC transporter protein LptC
MIINELKKILFFLGTVIILSGITNCGETKVKPHVDISIEEENLPVQESWNSKIIFTEDGITKAVLRTDHIRMFLEPREKLLTKVEIDFFDSRGKPSSRLTSKRGKVDDVNENMYAIDSVVAYNDSSKVLLETEELMWRKSDSKIVTEKFARITTPDEIMEGYGFESDQNLRNYVIYDITYRTTLKKKK